MLLDSLVHIDAALRKQPLAHIVAPDQYRRAVSAVAERNCYAQHDFFLGLNKGWLDA